MFRVAAGAPCGGSLWANAACAARTNGVAKANGVAARSAYPVRRLNVARGVVVSVFMVSLSPTPDGTASRENHSTRCICINALRFVNLLGAAVTKNLLPQNS